MQIENCLTKCDRLSLQIIGALLNQKNYDYISESLFISRSALNYRLKKIFSAASVSGRKEFETLFREYVTMEHYFYGCSAPFGRSWRREIFPQPQTNDSEVPCDAKNPGRLL